jgi:hypothetical protein
MIIESELTLQVPVVVPSLARMEQIYREVCANAAVLRRKWLRFDEAAKYLGISLRTFERKKDSKWGLPVFELDGPGAKVVSVADLDALVVSKLVRSERRAIIDFPSIADHEALLKKGAA